MTDEVNNFWSNRSKPSSSTRAISSPVVVSKSLTNSVTLQHSVIPDTSMDDDYDDDDIAQDSDDDIKPQVILNMASRDDGFTASANKDVFVETFCDICSIELINHADERPCDPDDGYVKVYKSCHVCHAFEPTREHVCRHFLPQLLELVHGFPNPLACWQCDYQVLMLKIRFFITNAEGYKPVCVPCMPKNIR